MKTKINFISLLIIFFCTSVFSQTVIPELITDRPDVTESALAVPVGSFQVESGFSFQQQKFTESGVSIENRSISLFSTLFRYGVLPNLEFRFGGEYFSNKANVDQFTSSVHGANELLIGSKLALRKEEAFLTNFAVMIEMTLPFGAEELKPEKFEPKFMLLAEQEISEISSLSGNFGVEYASDHDKYLLDYSITLGVDVAERIGVFAEVYGQARNGLLPEIFFDCGVTYLQTANLQVDFSIGSTLLENKTEWFAGVGISLRFMR